MKISKYGVSLVRLMEEDIELVRQWRNTDEIRKYMSFQAYITPDMQKKWFETINNPENFYYIIEYKGDKIGLVNDKNIDWKQKTAEGGMFIWDKRYINSIVPLKVSLLVLEMAYIMLGWNKTFIKVRKDNSRAIEYNKALGYEMTGNSLSQDTISMELKKDHFFKKYKTLKRLIGPDSENEKIKLVFEKTDEMNGTREAVEEIIKQASKETSDNKIDIVYS